MQRKFHARQISGHGLRKVTPVRAVLRHHVEPYRNLRKTRIYDLSNGSEFIRFQEAPRQPADSDLYLFQTPPSRHEPPARASDENGFVRLAGHQPCIWNRTK